MINYNEALEIINENFRIINKNVIEIDIQDSLNFVLAEDILTDIDIPPFTHSSMDGFAVNYSQNICQWNVIGEISAGNYADFILDENSAVSIMTGAKMPPTADTVVPIENVEMDGNHFRLLPDFILKKDKNIRYQGEDIKKGEISVPKNTLIEPKTISIIASCGMKNIKVFKPLKIGVLSTGDELIDIDSPPQYDQIRASNLFALIACIKNLNMTPVNFGIIRDNPVLMEDKLNEILKTDIDILVTCGGVSVGKHDYLKQVLESIGAEVIFWKVNIKPGKPLLFSVYTKSSKPVLIFSLPGNPVSSFVNFQIFIREAIYHFYQIFPMIHFSAVLTHDIIKKDTMRHFIRADAAYNNFEQKTLVGFSGGQSSGNMIGLNNSNCLIVFEEDKQVVRKGETVDCIKI